MCFYKNSAAICFQVGRGQSNEHGDRERLVHSAGARQHRAARRAAAARRARPRRPQDASAHRHHHPAAEEARRRAITQRYRAGQGQSIP